MAPAAALCLRGWAGPGPALPLPRARGSRSPLLGWTFAGRLSPSSLRRSAHRNFQRSISESRKTKRNRKYVTPVSKHAGAGNSALKEPAAPGCPPHTRRHADVVPRGQSRGAGALPQQPRLLRGSARDPPASAGCGSGSGRAPGHSQRDRRAPAAGLVGDPVLLCAALRPSDLRCAASRQCHPWPPRGLHGTPRAGSGSHFL